ncbi:MAG: hypothetical protein AAFX41_01370 [Bacteroidota bacterium]
MMFRLFLLVCFLTAAPTWAQDVGYVRVETNAPEATFFVNGRHVMLTDDGVLEVAPGTIMVLALVGEPDTWDARRASATVDVSAGTTVVAKLDLPIRYRINSVPYGATVVHEAPDGTQTQLGATPLSIDRPVRLDGTLHLDKDGYASQQLAPGSEFTNEQSVLLRPLRAEDGAEVIGLMEARPNRWIDVAAGALALAGGATAVYFKLRADDVDDRYRDPGSPERGDPALRDEAARLDTYSAVGLGAMQVGLGVIAVRLVLR